MPTRALPPYTTDGFPMQRETTMRDHDLMTETALLAPALAGVRAVRMGSMRCCRPV